MRVLRRDGLLFVNLGDSYHNKRTGYAGSMNGQSVHEGEARGKVFINKRRQGIEGKVLLRVTVAPDGRIAKIVVVESSGHPVLDRAARDGVARWRFAQAHRGGTSIASVVDVPIEFKLNN